MERKSIRSDANGGSCGYIGKHVVEVGSNEGVGLIRSSENEKLKDKVCYGGGSTDSEMLSSWTQRLYSCSFCKRRFKSAQALGGHMNVHRRARAMLRSQSVSLIPSHSSSTWLPNCITTADHPFQHDDYHFKYPNNPSPNLLWPLNTASHAHLNINPSPSSLSHHSIFNLTPSCCNHMSLQAQAQYHSRERVKKNCIRAENQLNGICDRTKVVNQDDDMLSRLSLGNGLITSMSSEEDINLELRLGL